MFYQPELNFLRNILKHYRLQTLLSPMDSIDVTQLDMGLRQIIGIPSDYKKLMDFLTNHMESNQIYRVHDSFSCSYFFLLLPATDITTILSIGPFIQCARSSHELMELIEQHALSPQLFPTFEKYLGSLPQIEDDSALLTLLHTFAEKIWGTADNYSLITYEHGISDIAASDVPTTSPSEQEDTLFQMQMLEQRYAMENELLHAVSQGLINKADIITSTVSSSIIEQRSTDILRNTKNYSIIINTLLRKAAEYGSVHPYYIDKISSDFARKIENSISVAACEKLQFEMIRKYCLLVKNHSMKGYSPLVQRVIMRIDSDLTADLSLSAIAAYIKTNPSYLSTQFKKETGSTLTDYVNRKRVEHALLLLNSTSMQIQTIAQYCGIPDVNYFTKLFKKYINKTPKDYRAEITGR